MAESGGAADRAPAWQRLAAELADFATAWPRLAAPAPGAGTEELSERLARLSSLVTELTLADLAGTELATILGHYGSAAGGADLGRACLRLAQASAVLLQREAVVFQTGMARFAGLASSAAAADRHPARLLGLFIETQDAVRGEALLRGDHVACHAAVLNAALEVEVALRAGAEAVSRRMGSVSRAEFEQMAARVAVLENGLAATASARADAVGITAPARGAGAGKPTVPKIKTRARAASSTRVKPLAAKTARNAKIRPATSPRRRR